MGFLGLLCLLAAADPVEGLARKMFPVYLREAAEYSIAVESAPRKRLELKQEPIFEWTNPIRSTPQHGVIFLWLRDGRPAAVGCIFCQQDSDFPGRRIMHELHALDREKLLVRRPAGALNQWQPRVGLDRHVVHPERGALALPGRPAAQRPRVRPPARLGR